LYRAWRPETFSEICGQEAITRTLKRQVMTGRVAHAYLFCGTRGTGKTTAAKVLSRAINCLTPRDGDPCGECEICRALKQESSMDVMEIDAASNNGVDEIRDLREKIKYPPTLTRYKVYIIDEVHMLSTGAFNALLKTLEEPPKHAVFILATTEPQRLPATILSRCQRFDFHRISMEVIIDRLKVVLAGIGRSASEEALAEIARAAEGAMRDALSLLDVCLSYTDGEVSGQLARDVLGTAGRSAMFEFVDALIDSDAGLALTQIDQVM
jgi:DNA polymerase-3 subunit gamma/tau